MPGITRLPRPNILDSRRRAAKSDKRDRALEGELTYGAGYLKSCRRQRNIKFRADLG
jgi:hypothetical protein